MQEFHSIYLALGSNLGPSDLLFQQAIELLKESRGMQNVCCSKFYETEPVDCHSERLFLNGVVRLESSLSLHELFARIEEIELFLGKKPKAKNAPRRIDIDLIFYDELIYSDQKITIPHPQWYKRLFVLKPLADLTHIITLSHDGFSISINIPKLLSLASKKGEVDGEEDRS